jgi:hypothetical protein
MISGSALLGGLQEGSSAVERLRETCAVAPAAGVAA